MIRAPRRYRVLVVDDHEGNLQVVGATLTEAGHDVVLASSGEQALERIESSAPDLILLDVIMPEMNGFEVCQQLRLNPSHASVPVIFLSAADEKNIVQRGLDAGGVDYVTKPFNKAELLARVRTHLALREARARADQLLANILPDQICERLKNGERNLVSRFPSASVIFSDVVGFTPASEGRDPAEIVVWLNVLFSKIDRLAGKHGLQRIKTIGDAYMAAAGVEIRCDDHAQRAVEFALDVHEMSERSRGVDGEPLTLRTGIHSGDLVAGVIGDSHFAYDLWGDTVNTAQRLEESCAPGNIHISSATRTALPDGKYVFEPQQRVKIRRKEIAESVFVRRITQTE